MFCYVSDLRCMFEISSCIFVNIEFVENLLFMSRKRLILILLLRFSIFSTEYHTIKGVQYCMGCIPFSTVVDV